MPPSPQPLHLNPCPAKPARPLLRRRVALVVATRARSASPWTVKAMKNTFISQDIYIYYITIYLLFVFAGANCTIVALVQHKQMGHIKERHQCPFGRSSEFYFLFHPFARFYFVHLCWRCPPFSRQAIQVCDERMQHGYLVACLYSGLTWLKHRPGCGIYLGPTTKNSVIFRNSQNVSEPKANSAKPQQHPNLKILIRYTLDNS